MSMYIVGILFIITGFILAIIEKDRTTSFIIFYGYLIMGNTYFVVNIILKALAGS